MFFIINIDAKINLNGCNFNFRANAFLKAIWTSARGSSGSNGGFVTLTLNNRNIEGDFVVDLVLRINNKNDKFHYKRQNKWKKAKNDLKIIILIKKLLLKIIPIIQI